MGNLNSRSRTHPIDGTVIANGHQLTDFPRSPTMLSVDGDINLKNERDKLFKAITDRERRVVNETLKNYKERSHETDEKKTLLSAGEKNALHLAVEIGELDILKDLVDFSGDCKECIKQKDSNGNTPLHLAVQNPERIPLLKCLLEHPQIQVNEPDGAGMKPVQLVCKNTEMSILLEMADSKHRAEVLEQLGLILYENGDTANALRDMCKCDEVYSSKGNTLLHIAVEAGGAESREGEPKGFFEPGHDNVAQMCLDLDVPHFSPSVANTITGLNSLHIAAKVGNHEIAPCLLNEREDIIDSKPQRSKSTDPNRAATPLCLAAKYNQPDMVTYLLKSGANFEVQAELGYTPLMLAILHGNKQCVEILLKHIPRNIQQLLIKDDKEGYGALHWAVEMDNLEILTTILEFIKSQSEESQRLIWELSDNHKNTAHHLAARSNSRIIKLLMKYDTTSMVKRNANQYTPFLEAVAEGQRFNVAFMSGSAAESKYALTTAKTNDQDNALHLAAMKGHSAIAQQLITRNDMVVCSRNVRYETPLHKATEAGKLKVLEVLLKSAHPGDVNLVDSDQRTPLYLACSNGHELCVELLVKHNAMVTYKCAAIPATTELLTKSCLDIAIDQGHLTVVTTLLMGPKWKQALQFCDTLTGQVTNRPMTPMRKLIKQMPAAAKLVLDRCQGPSTDQQNPRQRSLSHSISDPENAVQQVQDEDDCKYVFDFIEDFQDAFEEGGPMIAKEEDRKTNRHPSLDRETSNHERKANPCDQNTSWGPKNYNHHNHPVLMMVEEQHEELLVHPVVVAWVHSKMKRFGNKFFLVNYFNFWVFVLLLTTYMHVRFYYFEDVAGALKSQILNCNSSVHYFIPNNQGTSWVHVVVIALFVIIAGLIRMIFEVLDFYSDYKNHGFLYHWTSIVNFMELFLYVATVVFAIATGFFHLDCYHRAWEYVWQLGTLCLFLSWFDLSLLHIKVPLVGIYVVMMLNIIKSYILVSIVFLFVLIAFGLSFFMLLGSVAPRPMYHPWQNTGASMLKVIMMGTGEYDGVEELLFAIPYVFTYPVLSYVLWVVFLIIVPLVLNNMLVGLAVDDISGLQKKAFTNRQEQQITFVLSIMSSMSPKLRVRMNGKVKPYTMRPGSGIFDLIGRWMGNLEAVEKKKDDLSAEGQLLKKMDASVNELFEEIQALQQQNQVLMEHMVYTEGMVAQQSEELKTTSKRQSSGKPHKTFNFGR